MPRFGLSLGGVAGDATAPAEIGLADGQPVREAARFACAAGARALTVMGAAPSLPAREANVRLVDRHQTGVAEADGNERKCPPT
jgi:hypothetical protein